MFPLIQKLIRAPLVAIAYVGFAIGGGILGTLLMPWLHVWPGTKIQKQRRCQALTAASFRVFHWYLHLTGMMSYRPPAKAVKKRIEATIRESAQRGGAAAVMVVPNHPTLIDTCAIIASFPYLVVVAKAKVFHFPLLRLLLHFCGHTKASVDLGGEAALAEQLIERMKNGESVLLFPEATRSPDDGPRPFRRGPFEIATRAGAAIQPILIESVPGLLKGGRAWYNVPPGLNRYALTALSPWFPSTKHAGPESPEHGSSMGDGSTPSENTGNKSDGSQANKPTYQAATGRQLAQLVFDQISTELRICRQTGALAQGNQLGAKSSGP